MFVQLSHLYIDPNLELVANSEETSRAAEVTACEQWFDLRSGKRYSA
jgi:hypothetical protein